MGFEAIPADVERVASDVIGAAIEVHRHLGPGFLELKAATKVDPALEAKVISYLRTTGCRLGLLLNFNSRTMKEGVRRIVFCGAQSQWRRS